MVHIIVMCLVNLSLYLILGPRAALYIWQFVMFHGVPWLLVFLSSVLPARLHFVFLPLLF